MAVYLKTKNQKREMKNFKDIDNPSNIGVAVFSPKDEQPREKFGFNTGDEIATFIFANLKTDNDMFLLYSLKPDKDKKTILYALCVGDSTDINEGIK